jgi:large subunit ribosomal protein L35
MKTKQKTKKAVAKRFSITANGKIKRKRAGLRHILEHWGKDSKRGARKIGYVHPSDEVHVLRNLPYGSTK